MSDNRHEEILKRFVLRARRIEAHSLVKDRDELLYHARGQFQITFSSDGTSQFLRRLPKNEEEFESLAARVRPLTLSRESIYYTKVFNAITLMLGEDRELSPFWGKVKELRNQWKSAEIKSEKIQAFAFQQSNVDGTGATALISDSQLAEAWLYTDLVHADPEDGRDEALSLSLDRRYEAAVRIFSMVAVLAVQTLSLIKELCDSGLISIEGAAWEEPVVVSKKEILKSGEVHFQAHDGEVPVLPDMRDGLKLGEGWSTLTLTSAVRMDPANRVDVALVDDSGEDLASYEAAVIRRTLDGSTARWSVLVDESVIFNLTLVSDSTGGLKFSSCKVSFSAPNNERKHRVFRFRSLLVRSKRADFNFLGAGKISLDVRGVELETAGNLEALREIFSDISIIEKVRGEKFDTCEGEISEESRLWLRLARLLWEGSAVAYGGDPLLVARDGDSPQPKILVMPERDIDVGGVLIPVPRAHISHPEILIEEQEPSSDFGPGRKIYLLQPPPGEDLVIWAPEVFPQSGDQVPSAMAVWEIPPVA